MSLEQDFLPFATGAGANVVSQAVYAALAALSTGYQSGVAQSAQLNKTWRQSSIAAAVLAQFIVNNSGQPAIDDGTTATLLTNLVTAVQACARQNPVLADTGTVNAYAVANAAAFTAYPTISGLIIDVSIAHANTGASTLNVDGLGTKPIYGLGLQALQGGELPVNGVASLMYVVAPTVNSGNGAWVILECTGGAQQVALATASNQAPQLSQVLGKQQLLTSSGTFTVPTGVTTLYCTAAGGGGGGGGGGGNSSTGASGGGGGGGGGAAIYKQAITVTSGQVLTVTIGAAGTSGPGGSTAGTNGTTGGNGGTTTITGTGPTVNISLAGGSGGVGSPGVTTNGLGGGAGGGTAGGTGGQPGAAGGFGVLNQLPGAGGAGGGSLMGPGGLMRGTASGSAGSSGQGFGAGSAGGSGGATNNQAGGAGGAGAPGAVLFEW